jgi:hypothetical protein
MFSNVETPELKAQLFKNLEPIIKQCSQDRPPLERASVAPPASSGDILFLGGLAVESEPRRARHAPILGVS